MKLTQVRNATLFIEYAGTTFLIDPMLAEKDAWDGFAGTARSHIRNPMTALPIATESLVNADIVIVTQGDVMSTIGSTNTTRVMTVE